MSARMAWRLWFPVCVLWTAAMVAYGQPWEIALSAFCAVVALIGAAVTS